MSEEPTSNNITIGLWNANGLTATKVSELLSFCHSFTVIFITESKLTAPSRLHDTEGWTQFHLYGPPVYVNPTYNRGSQGVVALVNPNCPVTVTHLLSPNPYTLSLQFGKLRISCLYLPPSLSLPQVFATLDTIPLQQDSILCGDFNARFHHFTGDTDRNVRGTRLQSWCEDHDLSILNATMAHGDETFTRMVEGQQQKSIIDLFITNNLTILQNPSMFVDKDLVLGSDHCVLSLTFDLEVDSVAGVIPDAVPPRRLWNLTKLLEPKVSELYTRHFVQNAKELFDSLDYTRQQLRQCPEHAEKPDMDALNDTLCSAIYSALDNTVGNRKPRPATWHKYWTPALQAVAAIRNNCYRRWRNANGVDKVFCWIKYQVAKKNLCRDILTAKRLSWRDYCNSMDTDFNKAISTIKNQKRNRESSGTFTHPEGPAAASTAMVNHLAQVYNGHLLPSPRPTFSLFSENELPHPSPIEESDAGMFKADQIEEVINWLPRRKAPGVDHLRAEMLVPLRYFLGLLLSRFFEICCFWSDTPMQWRHAQVFPIFKKGDPAQASNYRPISLTSIIRKLFEMVLKHTVEKYSPRIDVAQGGFKSRHSALDQALCLHDLIQDYYHSHHDRYPVVAFLDIATAYDSVDRTIIWKALRENGMPIPLLGLLQNLFDQVSISVLIGNATSTAFSPATGVLQGSVLSPMLYSIFINSLPVQLRDFASPLTTRVKVPSTSTSESSSESDNFEITPINSLLFADDVAIIGTRFEVQDMLDSAAAHSRHLGYRWKPEKCAVINHPSDRIDAVNPRPPLSLYGVALPQVQDFVYLGVPFSMRGIDNKLLTTQRAKGTIGAMATLHRMGANRSGFSLMLSSRLYKTFVRPKFEYGLAISSLATADLKAIEKLQDRCLRLMVGGHPTSSTAALKLITNIPSVSWRIDVLITKFCIRTCYLPKDCLLKLLDTTLQTRSRLACQLKRNRLFASLPPDPTSLSSAKLNTLLQLDRQSLHSTLMQNNPLVLSKACRPKLSVDPILYLPASRTDRSRLIRWRMGWLPGRPHDCVCTRDHTSRRHFSVGECDAIPGSVFDSLPHPPPNVHIIDHAISMLPIKTTTFCEYWPALLELLWYIECNVAPDTCFPEDAEFGLKWRENCSRLSSRSTVSEQN